jgi:beta-hydroxylase
MSGFPFTDKNPSYFYELSQFPFLKPLQDNADVIREELISLMENQSEDQWVRTFPHYVRSQRTKAWKVFSFMFFNIKYFHNAKLCPRTSELIYSIPEIMSCDFSFLEGNTHIAPHKGYSRMVLRSHLPLIVPDEKKCALRVGDNTKHWKENEILIFDDSFEHEAWNKTDESRVVLMFDIPNPLWNYSAYEISKFKIENLEDPFLLSLATKQQWIDMFNKGGISP